MAGPSGTENLITLYVRSPLSCITRGDHVDGKKVLGFAYDREPASGEPGDRLLLEGDEDLERPPHREVPSPQDDAVTIDRLGPSLVESLDSGMLVRAPQLQTRLQRLILERNGDPIRLLLAALLDEGHEIWLVGGAVRDLFADGADGEVGDLDFTGTVGPGELVQLAEDILRASDGGDYVSYLSPDMVWSLAPNGIGAPWLMEYRPLTLDGFKFAAYGGDLAADAQARDLTINTLYHDIKRAIVADPTGYGRQHLQANPRILAVAYRGTEPMNHAGVLLRCMKFVWRWPTADRTNIVNWARALPEDLAVRLPPDSLRKLASLREEAIPHQHRGQDELRLAHELGRGAFDLVKRLQQWTA